MLQKKSNSCVRRIKFKNVNNFRDLGGYFVSSSSFTRWGRLFRSDSLDMLSSEEWGYIIDFLNIAMIIDLRSDEESKRFSVCPPDKIKVLKIPLISQKSYVDLFDQTLDIDLHREEIRKNLIQDYTSIIFENIDYVTKALLAINHYMKTGGIVFFCSAGKDRTGILAAIILYLCGVAEADIIADYCITEIYNNSGLYRRFDSKLNKTIEIEFSDELKEMKKSSPAKIKSLLYSFKKRNINELLNDHGFLYKDQNELIKQFVIEKV